MTLLLECVMPHRYQIILIRERYHPLTVYFGDGEQVLKYVAYSLAQGSCEIVEYQVRVRLGYRLYFLIDVMPENHILQPKVRCGAQREMTNYHPIWLTSMLMQNNHISQPFSLAQVHQVFHHIPSPIDSFRVREQHSYFFLELQ